MENTYLAHTHSARWSPSADESTEDKQMSAINMHSQSLSGIRCLILYFLQEIGTPVFLRNQSYSTALPARGWKSADVSAQHMEYRFPRPGIALPGGDRHKGTEFGHTIVVKWLSSLDVRCLGGHSQLTASQQGCPAQSWHQWVC